MNFEWASPPDLAAALELKADGAEWYAGGTDLIPELKLGIRNPSRLVNIKEIKALRGIRVTSEGVQIGALTTLSEIGGDSWIGRTYRALGQACVLAASPQIRNTATIGGNLCQDSRCAYYRDGFACYLRGGDTCFLKTGDSREGSVVDYKDCAHAHPSDPAVALVALDASILVQGRGGMRSVPASDFFHSPHNTDRRMTLIGPDELITAIVLPPATEGMKSAFLKAMDRAVWTFALASAAVRLVLSGQVVSEVRIVTGGVAPTPHREMEAERRLIGATLDDETIAEVAAQVLTDAVPLAHNAYKVPLARALVKRALDDLRE